MWPRNDEIECRGSSTKEVKMIVKIKEKRLPKY